MNCDWATLCAHSIQMGFGHGMSELMVCCSMCTQDAHACLSSCRECNHKFYWNYFIDKLMFSLHIQSRVHASTICLAYPFRPSPTTHKIVWFCHHYVYAFRLYAGICFFFARFEFLPKIQPIFEMSAQLFGQISIMGCFSKFIYTCCRWHKSEFSLEIMAVNAAAAAVRNMRDSYVCCMHAWLLCFVGRFLAEEKGWTRVILSER